MSENIDNQQFQEMLANYMAEGSHKSKKPRKPAKGRKQGKRQPQRIQETPEPQAPPPKPEPKSIMEQVDAAITGVKKGVDPRKVARRLLRG